MAKRYYISAYDNSGTFVLNSYDGSQSTQFENSSPVIYKRMKYPMLVSLHKSNVLQLIDLDKRTADQIKLEDAVVKETNILLVDENRLLMVSASKVIVFSPNNLSATTKVWAYAKRFYLYFNRRLSLKMEVLLTWIR